MKFHVLAIFDSAAAVYGLPNFVPNVGSAIRSFGDEVAREAADNVLNRHPAHFSLFKMGMYDDKTGLFDVGVPELVANASDFAAPRRQAQLDLVDGGKR